ncbi:MAG: cysteine desulfurase [Patescibacteria group bacterium]
MLNPQTIKKDFPIFKRKIKNKSLVYLDSASTSQKPRQVIKAISNYYENFNANIHRGVYALSEEATQAYENSRKKTAEFINSKSPEEIIFTRNTTESINLVAYSWGEQNIKSGDEIIVSAIEHHSNLVPWQQLCQRKNAKLRIIPLKENLSLDYDAYLKLLSSKTKLVAISATSNVTGLVPDLNFIIKNARKFKAHVLVDGAQSVAHSPTDLQKMDCDFFAFSSHKMLGPTGVGVLYVKKTILEKMPPFLFGGDMVRTVDDNSATWNDTPWNFEAGTPNIADVIAFGAALDYLQKIGLKNIQQHDKKLLDYAVQKFSKYPQLKLYVPPKSERSSVLSFTIQGIHPHDIASIFNEEGVCIRSGHHCNQPLMLRLKIPATARLSFYFYNTTADIDRAEKALKNVLKIFKI